MLGLAALGAGAGRAVEPDSRKVSVLTFNILAGGTRRGPQFEGGVHDQRFLSDAP